MRRILRTVARKLRRRSAYNEAVVTRRSGGVTVVVGSKKDDMRVFCVDSYILESSVVQPILSTAQHRSSKCSHNLVIHIDSLDAILFDHILWLLQTNDSSLRNFNLDALLDFYHDKTAS